MTVKREHLYFMFYPLQGVLYIILLFCHSKKPTWLSSILRATSLIDLNFLSLGNEAGYQFRSRGSRGKRLMKDVSMEIQHNTIGPHRKSGNHTIKFSRDYSNAEQNNVLFIHYQKEKTSSQCKLIRAAISVLRHKLKIL